MSGLHAFAHVCGLGWVMVVSNHAKNRLQLVYAELQIWTLSLPGCSFINWLLSEWVSEMGLYLYKGWQVIMYLSIPCWLVLKLIGVNIIWYIDMKSHCLQLQPIIFSIPRALIHFDGEHWLSVCMPVFVCTHLCVVVVVAVHDYLFMCVSVLGSRKNSPCGTGISRTKQVLKKEKKRWIAVEITQRGGEGGCWQL